MKPPRRHLFFVCAIIGILLLIPSAASPAPKPEEKKSDKYKDPKSTFQAYIEAVRKTDLEAAKECWVLDDDNKSGALDVMVGLWVSSRRLNEVTVKKFGKKGAESIPRGWRREDVTDKALDITKQRVADSAVKLNEDKAELKIKWQKSDGYPNEAFHYSDKPILFRKVKGQWKIDANRRGDLKTGRDFFSKGTWGVMFREQVRIMNEATAGVEKGGLKSPEELADFIKKAMIKAFPDLANREEKDKKKDK